MEAFYSRTFEDIENFKDFTKTKFCINKTGNKVPIDLDIIKNRIQNLIFELDIKYININVIVYKVASSLSENIETYKIDELLSETCAYMNLIHPSYSLLAARIAINSLHKFTNNSFVETIK